MIFRAIKSLFRTAYLKIRFGSKFSASAIQGFDKLKVEIDPKAKISLGEKNQNRGPLYLLSKQTGILTIGSHNYFNTNTYIACMGYITIKDRVSIGNNVVIVDHDHNFKSEESEFTVGKIEIGNNVWIGANVTILKDTVIGDNAVIAAGSVVKGQVPANTIFLQKRESEKIEIKKENQVRDVGQD